MNNKFFKTIACSAIVLSALSVMLCSCSLFSDNVETSDIDIISTADPSDVTTDSGNAQTTDATSADDMSTAVEITTDHTHEFTQKETIAPGCITEGYTVYACTCGVTEKRYPTNPLGHHYAIREIIAPTCTAKGYTILACTCGDVIKSSEVNQIAHTYVTLNATTADCLHDGITSYKCHCGAEKTEVTQKALGHSWTTISESNGTCLIAGTRTSKCTRCQLTKTEETTVPKHDYVIERTVVPSATQKGYTIHICLCGESYADTYVKATGSKQSVSYKTQNITINDARCGFVYSPTDNTVYKYGNMTDKLYPASITKLVTAMVAMEYAQDSLKITVGEELTLVPSGSSLAGLKKGNKVTLEQLQYGLLLPSGCDAGYVIAQGVGRVIDSRATTDKAAVKVFVAEMNNWSRKHGMDGTNWNNPDGNHDDNHYSTMEDLIKLAFICSGNNKLVKYTSTVDYSTIIGGKTIAWTNSNSMLTVADDCFGLKTGNTLKAGYCLLSTYGSRENPMIIGVFGCAKKDQRVSVSEILYNQYKSGAIVNTTETITTSAPEPITTAPEVTTSEPVTTDSPETSSTEPITTTSPESSTSAPVTTEIPETSFIEPITTESPSVSSSEPMTTVSPETVSEPITEVSP